MTLQKVIPAQPREGGGIGLRHPQAQPVVAMEDHVPVAAWGVKGPGAPRHHLVIVEGGGDAVAGPGALDEDGGAGGEAQPDGDPAQGLAGLLGGDVMGDRQGIEGADTALAGVGVQLVRELAEDPALARLGQDEGGAHLAQRVIRAVAQHGVVADDGAGLVDGDPGQELAGAALFQDPLRVVDDVLVAIAVEVPGGTGEGQGLLGGLEAPVADLALDPDLAPVGMQDVRAVARRQGRQQPLDHLEFLPLLLDIAPLDAVHGPGDQEGAQAPGGFLQGPRRLVMGQTGEVEGPAGGPRHQADRRVLEFDPETNRGVRPLRNGMLEEVDQALFQGQFDLPADRVGHPQAAAQVGEQGLHGAETGVMSLQLDVDAVV